MTTGPFGRAIGHHVLGTRAVRDHGDVERASDYELIDAGDGRRLERFGERVVDRPAPAASEPAMDPTAWDEADLRFDRNLGWHARRGGLEPWPVQIDELTLELRATEAGQVGAFPEQQTTWAWIREQLGAAGAAPRSVLNLFAYTGGATLAAAAAGARVAHVDASRPAIAWARRNAALSGLEDRPIRWLVDDAEGFLAREARRGRRYDGLILDPPTYGHGPAGRAWRLEERLDTLLRLAARVAEPGAFVVLTTHTPGIEPADLQSALGTAFGALPAIASGRMDLEARSGARLSLGARARMILPP